MIGYTIGMLVVTFTLYQYSKCATSSLVAAGHYDPENGNHMSLGKGFYIALSYCWIAATLAAYNGLFTSAWSTALSSSISTGNNYFFVNTSCVSTAYFQVDWGMAVGGTAYFQVDWGMAVEGTALYDGQAMCIPMNSVQIIGPAP